jgi:quercetin dioxygenase-like cupin family protein
MGDRRDYALGPHESRWQPPPGAAVDGVPGFRYMVLGEDSEDRYALCQYEINGLIPPHVHQMEDESVYVLDGEITVHVGDTNYDLMPGSFVFMPRGVPHAISVRQGPWRGISVSAPGGVFDKMQIEMAETMAETITSGREFTPTDMEALQRKYGFGVLTNMEVVPGRGLVEREVTDPS